MLLYRLCRRPHADLSGEGARLYGGRWNKPGLPMVYTAENAALAVLEMRVHLDLPFDLLPEDYVLVTIHADDALEIEDAAPEREDARTFGTDWLQSRRTPLLRVPSAIVPESRNVLVNPAHPEAAGVRVESVRSFEFDGRLWTQ